MVGRVEFVNFSGVYGDVQRKIVTPSIVMTESLYLPNSRVGLHAHRQGCFGVVLEGEYLEGVRHEEFVCGSRSVLFRPPLTEHWSTKGKTGARVLFLDVSDDWLDHIREYSPVPDQPTVLRSGHIPAFAASICRHWREDNNSALLAVEGLLYEIAADISPQRPQSEEHGPKWLNGIIEILHEKFNEPVKLSAIASEVGYHPVYVTRVFRRHYGMTIADYVRRLRIDFAREHLARDDMSLVDVALSAGFPSQAYFSTTFKQETGLTPGRYRRTMARSPHGNNPCV